MHTESLSDLVESEREFMKSEHNLQLKRFESGTQRILCNYWLNYLFF